jgi:quinol monooxygenase YgiN
MFAVAGTWTMDVDKRERRAEALPALVAGVRQNAGFVRGYWTEDVDDPAVSLTFIVFETLDQARAFREAVTANAPAQAESGVDRAGLRIVEVTADA